MNGNVAVVDYGVGNLFSVCRALEAVGASPTVSSDPNVIRRSDRIVFPGVGAFSTGMSELRIRDLIDPLREIHARQRPLLAICLGMQMLFDTSDEFSACNGISLLPGKVVGISSLVPTSIRVPHVGWSELRRPESARWNGTILEGINDGDAVYFVHSFAAVPDNVGHRLADTILAGTPLTAVVGNGMTFGCQFHPEKSGPAGLAILTNFMAL